MNTTSAKIDVHTMFIILIESEIGVTLLRNVDAIGFLENSI